MRFADNNNQVLQFFQENQVIQGNIVETQLKKMKPLLDKGPKEFARNKNKYMKIAAPIMNIANKIPNLENKVVKESMEYMQKEGIKNGKSRVMKYKTIIKKYIQDDKQATAYASIAAALSIKNEKAVNKIIIIEDDDVDTIKKWAKFKIIFGLFTICIGIVTIVSGHVLIFPFVMGTVLLVRGINELRGV